MVLYLFIKIAFTLINESCAFFRRRFSVNWCYRIKRRKWSRSSGSLFQIFCISGSVAVLIAALVRCACIIAGAVVRICVMNATWISWLMTTFHSATAAPLLLFLVATLLLLPYTFAAFVSCYNKTPKQISFLILQLHW